MQTLVAAENWEKEGGVFLHSVVYKTNLLNDYATLSYQDALLVTCKTISHS